MTKLILDGFDNVEQVEYFLVWFSEAGEQELWNWADMRGEEGMSVDIDPASFPVEGKEGVVHASVRSS